MNIYIFSWKNKEKKILVEESALSGAIHSFNLILTGNVK